MEFVNPFVLFGLVAVAIPIIIHLFNFRKFQKVFFTNVRFIEELKQQTQKQAQIKHLLILLMRILAIICLVLAFSQPYIPVSKNEHDQEGRKAISVYLDNSFSMEAVSNNGNLLDEAVGYAQDIASSYNTTDLFSLITNDFEGRHQRFVSRDEFIEMLDEVEISPVTRKMSEVLKRQSDLLHQNYNSRQIAYLISDFQKSISDFENAVPDSNLSVYVVPVEITNRENLYIDSIWFDSPVYRVNQVVELNINIKNASDSDFEKIPAKLLINGQQRAIASFDIQSDKEIVVKMPFTINQTGILHGKVEIVDYPIIYDDSFFFSFEVKAEIPVLAINNGSENIYLNSFFGMDSAFVFTNADERQLDYSSFNQYSLIILNSVESLSSGLAQELTRFASGGGSIVVFPGKRIDQGSYNDFTNQLGASAYANSDTAKTRVSSINAASRIYNDVFESIPENIDLPKVLKHYVIRKNTTSMMEVLLEMQNGNIFLGVEPAAGNGLIYIFAVPLDPDWSNLPKHAILVPTFYKIALLSTPQTRLFYTTGQDEKIMIKNTLTGSEPICKISAIDKEFEIIPEIRSLQSQMNIFTYGQVKEAGNYRLLQDSRQIAGLSFNYDRRESELQNYMPKELQEKFLDFNLNNFSVISTAGPSLSDTITALNTGFKLWKIFVIMSLVFFLSEILLLRFWK
jgi:hypothetical protein